MKRAISSHLLRTSDPHSLALELIRQGGLSAQNDMGIWWRKFFLAISLVLLVVSNFLILNESVVIAFLGFLLLLFSVSFIGAALWTQLSSRQRFSAKPMKVNGGGWQLVLNPAIVGQEVDPIVKILNSLILLGVYDKVTKIVLGAIRTDYILCVEIDGSKHDLEPPPPEIHLQIVDLVKATWRHTENDSSLNIGSIEVTTDRGSAKVTSNVTWSTTGEILHFSFELSPEPENQ